MTGLLHMAVVLPLIGAFFLAVFWGSFQKAFRTLNRLSLLIVFKCIGVNLRIENAENIPRNKACLFVANYEHIIDTLLVAYAIPGYCIVTGKFFHGHSSLSILERLWMLQSRFERALVIDPRYPIYNYFTMDKIIHKLRSGSSVSMFCNDVPSTAELIGDVRTGAAFVACHASVPLVPITIHGSHRITEMIRFFLLGKGSYQPITITIRFNKTITIGKEIALDQTTHYLDISRIYEEQIRTNYVDIIAQQQKETRHGTGEKI